MLEEKNHNDSLNSISDSQVDKENSSSLPEDSGKDINEESLVSEKLLENAISNAPKKETVENHQIENKEGINTINEDVTSDSVITDEGEIEVPIDFSKVKLDSEGIPEITKRDIYIIKESGFAFDGFELQINVAKSEIERIKHESDLDYQNEIEGFHKQQIIELQEQLKDLTDETKIKSITDQIQTNSDIINSLHKNSNETKKQFEEIRKSSINLLASYQLVAREDVGNLIKDGTIISVISTSAIQSFIKMYTDLYLKEKNIDIDKLEEIITIKKQIKEFEEKSSKLSSVFVPIKEYQNLLDHKEFINKFINYTNIEFEENKVNLAIDELNVDKLKEYKDNDILKKVLLSQYFNKLIKLIEENDNLNKELDINLSEDSKKIINDKIEQLKITITSVRYDLNKEYNELKDTFNKDLKEFDKIQPQFLSLKNIQKEYESFPNLFDIRPEFNDYRLNFVKDKEDKYNEIHKEISFRNNLIESIKNKYVSNLYKDMKKEGLALSILKYSILLDKYKTEYCKSISYPLYQYHDILSDKTYYMIKSFIKNSEESEFNFNKNNINNITLFLNNLLQYLTDLNNDTVNIEWKKNFDEHGEIQRVWNENKDIFTKLHNQFNDVKDSVLDIIDKSSVFWKHLNTTSGEMVKYIDDLDNKEAKKQSIKDRYRKHLKAGYFSSFLLSSKELFNAYNKDENIPLDKIDKSKTNRFFNNFFHNTLGYNIIYTFMDIAEKMKNYNKNLRIDKNCLQYLFHEFILSEWSIKQAAPKQTAYELIKNKTKEIIFKSSDTYFMKDMDVDYARKELITYVYNESIRHMINFIKTYTEYETAYLNSLAKKEKEKNNKNNISKNIKELQQKKKNETKKINRINKKKAEIKKALLDIQNRFKSGINRYEKFAFYNLDLINKDKVFNVNGYKSLSINETLKKVIVYIKILHEFTKEEIEEFVDKHYITPNIIQIINKIDFDNSIPNNDYTGDNFSLNEYRSFNTELAPSKTDDLYKWNRYLGYIIFKDLNIDALKTTILNKTPPYHNPEYKNIIDIDLSQKVNVKYYIDNNNFLNLFTDKTAISLGYSFNYKVLQEKLPEEEVKVESVKENNIKISENERIRQDTINAKTNGGIVELSNGEKITYDTNGNIIERKFGNTRIGNKYLSVGKIKVKR
jgi:post-segregation antitoxin (ccd killing protein)